MSTTTRGPRGTAGQISRQEPPRTAETPVQATGSREAAATAPYGAPGTVSLTLPYPVSTNRLYRTVRRGRATYPVKSREAREYELRVKAEVLGWIIEHGGLMYLSVLVPEPPFSLTFTMYPPSRRRIDASNGIKLAEDAIFRALGLDDKTVVDVRMRVAEVDAANPRLEAVLEHAR